MYVLEVIPLSRTAPPEPLSYRSSLKLPVGSLVSVPLRKQVLPGLVVACMPVQEAKYALKNASFSLSKSTNVSQGMLPAALLRAAEEIALYHATTVGAVLSTLLIPVMPSLTGGATSEIYETSAGGATSEINRAEAPFVLRRETYEKQIIEALAEEAGAVLLVVPTQTEAEEWALLFKKFKPVVLSGKVTGKRREAALTNAPNSTGLIIATPSFAWVPIKKLSGIIIERASAGTYRLQKRPYLDVRYALASLARFRHARLTFGDYPLPLEYRADPAAALEIETTSSVEIYDARVLKSDVSKKEEREPWQAVPERIRSTIKDVLKNDGRVAVLAIRRGYSPTVVCRDCSTAVTEERGNALSLATVNGKRVFRSTDGTIYDDASMFCKTCGGWNLQPLGVGVERVEEELRAAFPEAALVRIDQDTLKGTSLKKIREEIGKPASILIGTEVLLPLLSPNDPVQLGVVASADSLLALPFWRSRERFVRLGKMLGERVEKMIVVTRRPEDAALSALMHSEVLPPESESEVAPPDFWIEETELRKMLSYPPFGTLIVFTIEGTAARLEEARASVRATCLPFIPFEPSQKIPSTTSTRATLVLHLKDDVWPEPDLSERLAHLSPAIRIHIDSESLW